MFSTCFLHVFYMFSQFCTRVEICVFRLGELHLGGLLDLVHGAATSSVHPLERGCQVMSSDSEVIVWVPGYLKTL